MKPKTIIQQDTYAIEHDEPGLDTVFSTDDLAEPRDFSLDPYAGGTYGGKPILPLDGAESVTNQIDSGRSVHTSNDVITFSFNALPHATGLFNNKDFGLNGQDGYTTFTPEQKDAARAAIELWDDLIPQSFVETNGRGADIIFANSDDPGQAFAYYPVPGRGWSFQSDVFIKNPDANPSNGLFNYGQYGNTTLIHELGHSLGLSHPGAYNGTGEFATDAEYAQDTNQYSIMSYFNGVYSGQLAINWDLGGIASVGAYNPDTGTYSFSFRANYSQGPQVHDIYVIQEKYGADPTTRADDTTYGFNSNAGNELYDFNANPFPYYAIYDAGGNDTIDTSGFDVSQYINLNDGEFSSIGGGVPSADEVNAYWTEYYAAYGLEFPAGFFTDASLATREYVAQLAIEYRIENATGVEGIYATEYDNVGIAYGSIIENAVGGQARDLIIGNEVANILDGQDGDDVLIGGGGGDTYIGGEGADTFVLDDLDLGDLITDFDGTGDGDMIDLTYFADSLGTDLTFIGDAAFTGASGEVRYESGMLEVSFGGDTVADYSATLANNADVDASMLALAMSA